MTGSGTSEDPYVVDNWADFETAISTSGAYVECVENLVFDMNEIAPDGLNLTYRCTNVNGNGLTIMNLFVQSGEGLYGTTTTTFNDIYFLNCYGKGTTIIGGWANQKTFNRCKFSGQTVSGSFLRNSGQAFNDCSFNIFATADSYFANANYKPTFTNCHLKFDGSSTHIMHQSSSYRSVFDNCLIEGSLPYTDFAIYDCTTSVLNIDISPTQTLDISNKVTVSVINTDKTKETDIPSGLLQVNSNQLTDAGYLRNIGFPIGVD